MADLIELIEVMLKQETSLYRTEDYLSPEFQQKLASNSPMEKEDSICALSSSCSSSSSGINESWREKICEWSYQVIDHFEFSREVVSISINLLDRFLAARPVNKKVFQLAAMTSLFIAIKLAAPGKLSMTAMIELSRGYFKADQMAAMEVAILRTLSWHVHPPTTQCFTKYLMDMLPFASLSFDARRDLLELSRFLGELSVMDYFFVAHRPSTVALAALLNAMGELPAVPPHVAVTFGSYIGCCLGIDASSVELNECRARLRLHYVQGGYSCPGSSPETENREMTVSPVCVSYGTQATHAMEVSEDEAQECFVPHGR